MALRGRRNLTERERLEILLLWLIGEDVQVICRTYRIGPYAPVKIAERAGFPFRRDFPRRQRSQASQWDYCLSATLARLNDRERSRLIKGA